MTLLLIDNYDSFTYNLYQYFGEILQARADGSCIDVITNDELTLDEIRTRGYDKIIISPGPGSPEDKDYFGVCGQVITQLGKTTPILGICLGMQGICHFFGGKVVRATQPMHGKTSAIVHSNTSLFAGLPQQIEVMRYHSLVADVSSLPDELEITAAVAVGTLTLDQILKRVQDDKRGSLSNPIEIMGLRHTSYPIEGVQFHPESFATEAGMAMLRQWVNG